MRVRWLLAVRRRPAVFVSLLLLSTAAVSTSVAGPILTRTVQQSATTSAVADAPLRDRSVRISATLDPSTDFAGATDATLDIIDLGNAAEDAPLAASWDRPRVAFASTSSLGWRNGSGPTLSSRYVTTDEACQDIAVVAGRCPTRTGEVLVAQPDLARSRTRIGSTVRAVVTAERRVELRVVGSYDPDGSPGAPLTRPASREGALASVTAEPLVVSPAEAQDVLDTEVQVVGRLDLRRDLGQDGKAQVRAGLGAITTRLSESDAEYIYSFDTGLPALLDRVDDQLRSAVVLILLSALQGCALTLFALVITAQQLARVRAAEWSIGRLQGVGRSRRWAAVYLEPVVPLVLGVPLGLAVSGWAAAAVVRRELRPGTPVELARAPVLLTAGVVGAVAVAAVILVSLPVLRRPLADVIQQRTDVRRLSPLSAVVQSMVVVLAVVTGYQLAAGGNLSDAATPLGLVAPGLFALAAALLAVRGAAAVARLTTRRAPRGLGGLVVGRRIARTPSALLPSLVVAVAVAVAVLSAQVVILSGRNQDLRADATVGAGAVLQVAPVPDAARLLAAVRTADPTGRYAMAAQELADNSTGGTSRIVAVDSTRLAAVSRWQPRWAGVDELPTLLSGSTVPAVTVRGRTVTVELTDVQVVPGAATPGSPAPPVPDVLLGLTVDVPGDWTDVILGSLATARRQELSAALPAGCVTGCRLVSWSLQTGAAVSYRADLTVRGLRTETQTSAATSTWLRDRARWRPAARDLTPDSPGRAVPRVTPGGLTITGRSDTGGSAQTVRSADAADPLPALVTARTQPQPVPGNPALAYGTGLDGQGQVIRPLGPAAVLPRALGDGVLVDLASVSRLSNPRRSQAVAEVWLAADAPADLTRRLTDAGLVVTARENLGETRDALRAQPMTRGAAVAAGVGAAALLLALLALVAGRGVDAERRRAEWLTLRRAGLRIGQVRRLAITEIGVPPLLGILLGTAAGIGAVRLSARQLPLVDRLAAGPPLELGVDWPSVVLVAAGSTAVVVAVACLGGLLETREDRS